MLIYIIISYYILYIKQYGRSFLDIFLTTSAVLSLPMYGAKASAPNKTLKKTSRHDGHWWHV